MIEQTIIYIYTHLLIHINPKQGQIYPIRICWHPKAGKKRGGPTADLGIKKTRLVELTASKEDGEEPHLHLRTSGGIWEFKTDFLKQF